MSQESQIEDGSSNPRSVGAGDYVVQQGDCISSIAFTHGHYWETIWQDPGNAELRRVRKDPNVLLPGDRVTISPIRTKQENKPTDKRHRFVRRGVPAKLRLRVMLEEWEESPGQGAPGGSSSSSVPPRPRANQPYRLQIDGMMFHGVTDADGRLEVRIPPDARRGRLIVGPDDTIIQLELGGLDPADEINGNSRQT
jgi:N-acetylmuramoyl-L-alanine amidase